MRPVLIHGPQGSGKTRYAKQLMEHYGCTHVMDEGDVGKRIKPGALILSQRKYADWSIPIEEALKAIGVSEK